ncbi:MAG: ABC transporter permease [Saprospiraceae bacterium]|nr:ABC transporter permease [Saprospiraceae bacterium]
MNVLYAELIKLKNANIVWLSFIAFGLAPVMGAVFILIMRDPDALANAGALSLKIEAMGIKPDWNAYLGILTQAIGVGGVLVFGFVASWIFGREYTDGTVKDLLSLPSSRSSILNAKFIIYIFWCVGLCISNLLTGLILGYFLQFPSLNMTETLNHLAIYFNTAFLTIIIGTPIAFFALRGKGYMGALGFVALTLVIAQIIGASGYGSFFPWAVPGLYSGISQEYKASLNAFSYGIVFLTGLIGYIATIFYWRYADQQ